MDNPHKGHRNRLRERYLRSGLDDYADHEILELLLTYAIPRVDVNPMAHALIDRFGSLSGVMDASMEELTSVDGIGETSAAFLRMLPEIFRRYEMDKLEPRETYDTLAQIGDYLRALYVGATVEKAYVLLFDNSRHLIGCHEIAEGTVNSVSINVPKIARLCFRANAASVVLAHNHPRGLAIPSGDDIDMTHAVDSALHTLGIQLLEHVIVTEHTFAPTMRRIKGVLRAAPGTDRIDEDFYLRFYGEA